MNITGSAGIQVAVLSDANANHVITTIENKRLLYVKDSSRRDLDKKYLFTYTEDEDEAKRFDNVEAQTNIDNAHNPFDRGFLVKKVKSGNRTKKVHAVSEDFA